MDLQKFLHETNEPNSELGENNVCFEIGDFSFETDGSINVIYTNHELNSPIYIFKVNY